MMAMRLLVLLPVLASSSAIAVNQAEPATKLSPNAEFLAEHYPRDALKRGEQGKVGFRITVEPDGSLGSCEVTQGSGFKALDNATCEIIVSYARLKKIENSDGRSVRGAQVGYIDWRLPEGAPKVATSASPQKLDNPDKIICKRTTRTGSWVARTKTCHTAREWAELSRRQDQEVERIMRGGAVEDGKQCAASISNPAGC